MEWYLSVVTRDGIYRVIYWERLNILTQSCRFGDCFSNADVSCTVKLICENMIYRNAQLIVGSHLMLVDSKYGLLVDQSELFEAIKKLHAASFWHNWFQMSKSVASCM